jgi:hypothetical protein
VHHDFRIPVQQKFREVHEKLVRMDTFLHCAMGMSPGRSG